MKKLKKPLQKCDSVFSCYITEPGVGNTIGKNIIVTGGSAAAMTGYSVVVSTITGSSIVPTNN